MSKYLALSKIKKGIVGLCFYDETEKLWELSSFTIDQTVAKINHYKETSPTLFYLLYNSSYGFQDDIMEIRNNFPGLQFICISGISQLEKEIVAGISSIPGLERNPNPKKFGGLTYPEYYLSGEKLSKAAKRAFLVMYLHKPWSEIGQVKLGEQLLFLPNLPKTNSLNNSAKNNNVQTFLDFELLKNINMSNLNPQVQELSEKLVQMSKLSYLGSLKAEEILFLVQKSRQFSQILEKFYTLKKNEETEDSQKSEKGIEINSNENNISN